MAFKKHVAGMMSVVGLGLAVACSSSSSTNGTGSSSGSGSGSGSSSGSSGGSSGSSGSSSGSTPSDAGDDAGTCVPANETNFKPPTWVPPLINAICSQAQLDSFFQCLRTLAADGSSPLPSNCDPWFSSSATTANIECENCVETKSTAPALGPIILGTNGSSINYAGCIAIKEGKTDGSGCGGAVAAEVACDQAACDTNCPLGAGSAADENALQNCLDDAADTVCQSFTQAASCTEVDGGPASGCFDSNPNDDEYARAEIVAAVFCGGGDGGAVTPPTGDSGTGDAGGEDASSDQ